MLRKSFVALLFALALVSATHADQREDLTDSYVGAKLERVGVTGSLANEAKSLGSMGEFFGEYSSYMAPSWYESISELVDLANAYQDLADSAFENVDYYETLIGTMFDAYDNAEDQDGRDYYANIISSLTNAMENSLSETTDYISDAQYYELIATAAINSWLESQ